MRSILAPRVIAMLASGVLVALLESGCGQQARPGPPAKPDVTVVTLRAAPISLTTELPGRVTASRVAEVRPQVSGVIQKRLFVEGDKVTAGQQLYQIDPAPYEASLASAQASLAHAKAAVTASRLTAERYKSLIDSRVISRQDYDNAVAALQQSEADVASGEAAIKTASINLTYTRVYAPIAGRTGRSSVTEGALVTADQANVLVTVTQLEPVYVDVTQPAATLVRLKRELAAGQIRSAGANQATVQLALEDGSAYESAGKLQFSEVTVDQGTGSVTLRAIFPNANELLLPGMFVRATIEEGIRDRALLAPQEGITRAPDGRATALIVGTDGKVVQRTVSVDRAIGAKWVVTGGLDDGDRLIVGGVQKAKPGMEVSVHEASAQVGGPHAVVQTTR
jgi:membrane fusion protein, multidrug efflux system